MSSGSDKPIGKLALVVAGIALTADLVSLATMDATTIQNRLVHVFERTLGEHGVNVAATSPFLMRYDELWPAYFVLCVLLASAVYFELTENNIPDEITFPGMLMGVGLAVGLGHIGFVESIGGLFLGVGVLSVFKRYFDERLQRESLGVGIITMVGMIGAFVGPKTLFAIVGVASAGGTVYLLARTIRDPYSRGEVMEFGPLIAIAAIIITPFSPIE